MDVEEIQARCEALLRNLRIPVPFDEHDFCAELGARSGRPIILRPLPLREATGKGILYGFVLSKPICDIICYEQNTSQAHRRQIVAHEASHLIFDHPSGPIDPAELPSLSEEITEGAQIRHVHRRNGVWTKEEREAELLASMILKRAAGLQVAEQISEPQLIEAFTRLEPFYNGSDRA